MSHVGTKRRLRCFRKPLNNMADSKRRSNGIFVVSSCAVGCAIIDRALKVGPRDVCEVESFATYLSMECVWMWNILQPICIGTRITAVILRRALTKVRRTRPSTGPPFVASLPGSLSSARAHCCFLLAAPSQNDTHIKGPVGRGERWMELWGGGGGNISFVDCLAFDDIGHVGAHRKYVA